MVYCFEPALRPLLGNALANVPSKTMITRIAISVISTVVFVILEIGPSAEHWCVQFHNQSKRSLLRTAMRGDLFPCI